MNFPVHIETHSFHGQNVPLFVPDPASVQQWYRTEQAAGAQPPFPYWTKLWPASLALAGFLAEQPHYVAGKAVLELAAGLGLPSLLAARWARAVCGSDHVAEAVELMQRSAAYNNLTNMDARVLDWNHLPPGLKDEVVLLSDVNYEPDAFASLQSALQPFLDGGATLLLATPQRLMAKPFIEWLQPWCTRQEERLVGPLTQAHRISILVLQQSLT